MDIHYNMCYHQGYETPRHAPTTRGAKASRHRPASIRQDLPICGRNAERFPKFRGALGAEFSKGRERSAPPQDSVWSSTALVACAKAQAPSTAEKGANCSRLYDRLVDVASHSPANRKTFPSALSSGPCMADNDEFWMDMAKTGAPGHPEGRKDNCSLEENGVAPYKKKPQLLEHISHSSTKADFCLSRMFANRGLRAEEPRFFAIAIGEIECPRSLPLPYPRNGAGLACTFAFIPQTSPARRSFDSCATFCDKCQVTSCSSGTAGPFTSGSPSRNFCVDIDGFMYIDSLHTPLNSIPMNLFGPRLNARFPTAHRKTSRSLASNSDRRFIASKTPNSYFGPAFTHQSCHGHE